MRQLIKLIISFILCIAQYFISGIPGFLALLPIFICLSLIDNQFFNKKVPK